MRSGESISQDKFLLKNFPDIHQDPELFYIKSRDNKFAEFVVLFLLH